MALTFNKFHSFVEALAEGRHNLSSDTLKLMLSNTAPAASNTVKTDIAEISAGNGYTAGGTSCTITSSSQTSGLYKLILADPPVWTASGGTVGPFRYIILYNDSNATDELIGWWDYGGNVTLNIDETFTVDFDNTNGVVQLS